MNRFSSFILLCCMLFAAHQSAAQKPAWSWVRAAGDIPGSEGNAVVYDGQAYVYVAGTFTNRLPLSTDTLQAYDGYSDIFLLKYHKTGKLVWARSYGGNGWDRVADLKLDASGRLMLWGNASFGFSFGNHTIKSGPFMASFDTSATCLWANNTQLPQTKWLTNIILEPSGNLWRAGYADSLLVFLPDTLLARNAPFPFLLRYGPYGKPDRALVAGSETGYFNSLLSLPNGGFVASGLLSSDMVLGTKSLHYQETGGRIAPCFLARYDSEGQLLWANNDLIGRKLSAYCFMADQSGNVLVSGFFFDTLWLRHSGFVMASGNPDPSQAQGFWASFSPDGQLRWIRAIPQIKGVHKHVDVDAAGRFYMAGLLTGKTVIGPDTLQPDQATGYLLCFDTEGNGLWGRQIGNVVNGISVAGPEEIYITGLTDSSKNFDAHQPYSGNYKVYFLGRLGTDPPEAGPVVQQIQLFPNPSSGRITVSLPRLSSASLVVYNSLGQQVFSEAIPDNQQYVFPVLSYLAPGVYHVLVVAEGFSAGQKLVIQY